MKFDYDAIIVGGGAAGLSAALILARARRSILICDAGTQRNRFASSMHGYITRDGIKPQDWIKLAHEDLSHYSTVSFRRARVNDARHLPGGFSITMEGDTDPVRCRKLLIATGVTDVLPEIPQIASYYGKTIFHCPYCDGYEVAGKRLAAYGKGDFGRQIALELLGWTDKITLFSDGPCQLDSQHRFELTKCGIRLIETKIDRLSGADGQLQHIVLIDGTKVECDALFFKTAFFEKSLLAETLGCNMDAMGLFATQKFESTNIPGLFVAGDACDHLHLVIEAAASGAEAAFEINRQLIYEHISDIMHDRAA